MNLSVQESYVKVNFSTLLEAKIVPPSFQRLLTSDHAENIYKGIKAKLDKGLQPLLPGCLIICETVEGNKWLVDGNHRFEAYKKIYTEMKEDLRIAVNYISVPDRETAEEIFRIVNKSMPIPEMPDGISLDLPNKLFKAVEAKYPKLFSESRQCQRPKICRDKFIEALGKLVAEVPGISPADFMQKFERYNNVLKNRHWRSFISKPGDTMNRISSMQQKCITYGSVFVGLKPDFQWLFYIYGHTEEDSNTILRPKITAALRLAVYEKHAHDFRVHCAHCKKAMNAAEFECGHIVSVARGGTTTLNNLVPVCGVCNRSVGSGNIQEFNKENGL